MRDLIGDFSHHFCSISAGLVLGLGLLGTASGASLRMIFPQFANGSAGGVLNRTRVILRNNSQLQDSGEIRFRSSSGQPALVPVQGAAVSVVPYALAPWGVYELTTDGTGTLQVGAVEVWSERIDGSGLEGSLVFDLLGSKLSVQGSANRRFNQVYVSWNQQENTGVAVYNLDQSASSDLELVLFDEHGVAQACRRLSLEPGQHLAAFIDEQVLFKDYFQAHPGNFRGTLSLVGEYFNEMALNLRFSKAAVLGLIQERTGKLALMALESSAAASTWFRVFNLQVGKPVYDGTWTRMQLTIDFEDPSGLSPGEDVRVLYNLNEGGIRGWSLQSPHEVAAGQTSGTMKLTLDFYGKFAPTTSLPIWLALVDDEGHQSNELTGTVPVN